MMQCPQCGTTYTDVTLRFCLADGATLIGSSDEQATVVRPGAMRVDLATESQRAAPTAPIYPPGTATANGGSAGIWKALVAVLAVILVLGGVGVIAALIYMNSNRGGGPGGNTSTPTPIPTATPFSNTTPTGTPDTRDQQIANLQRQLGLTNQQAGNTTTTNTMPSGVRTVRANSPGDGFLALRSQPSTETGERILKIPHGATLVIGACRGRWCRAVYNGYAGWVHDGYVR